jgi:CheY-like chemotaxis protein
MAKKILIIDDEELIIKSLKKLLEKNNFEAFVAKRSQDALVMVEEENFDLIIVDIRMPGMNGVEITKSIYKILEKKKKRKLPTIFITGYVDKEIEEEAKALNPVAYIYKPFNIPELVNRVKEVLG